MTRSISARTVIVCTNLEKIGPVSAYANIDIGGGILTHVQKSKMLQRLARDGLLIADRTVEPTLYNASADWREKVYISQKTAVVIPKRLTCVWDLGMVE